VDLKDIDVATLVLHRIQKHSQQKMACESQAITARTCRKEEQEQAEPQLYGTEYLFVGNTLIGLLTRIEKHRELSLCDMVASSENYEVERIKGEILRCTQDDSRAEVHASRGEPQKKESSMVTIAFVFLVVIVPLGIAAQRWLFKGEDLVCDPQWELYQQHYD
jgi:hypothetical protein